MCWGLHGLVGMLVGALNCLQQLFTVLDRYCCWGTIVLVFVGTAPQGHRWLQLQAAWTYLCLFAQPAATCWHHSTSSALHACLLITLLVMAVFVLQFAERAEMLATGDSIRHVGLVVFR